MKIREALLAGESSENSTGAEIGRLLPASPLTLEAVRALAISARDAQTIEEARGHLREQIQMLNQLIEQAEAEEGAIYEWASGQ